MQIYIGNLILANIVYLTIMRRLMYISALKNFLQ